MFFLINSTHQKKENEHLLSQKALCFLAFFIIFIIIRNLEQQTIFFVLMLFFKQPQIRYKKIKNNISLIKYKLQTPAMTTTFKISCTLFFLSLFTACGDSNYNGKNYVAFDTMDELSHKIIESIKNSEEQKMLKLLDNNALIFDLLTNSEGDDANKTKAYLMTEEGKRKFSVDQLARKQRINAFFSTGLPKQIKINKAAFRTIGLELVYEQAYSENSPAMLQSYQIRIDNGEKQAYAYDIQVIYWNQKYHLVEAAGFLNKL